MVSAEKDTKKKSVEQSLRDRVAKLTDELDALDHRQAQAHEALQGAVITLAGMGPAEMGGQVGQAVAGLKKVVSKRKPDLDKVTRAIDELKSALLAEPAGAGGRQGKRLEGPGRTGPDPGLRPGGGPRGAGLAPGAQGWQPGLR